MAWITLKENGQTVDVPESTAGQMVLGGYAERASSRKRKAEQPVEPVDQDVRVAVEPVEEAK